MPNSDSLRPIEIRRIRQARDETQAEFAEHLDVSQRTVCNWELAEYTPSDDQDQTIRELAPSDLDLQAIATELDWSEQRAALSDTEKRLYCADVLRQIRERPRTSDEFASGKGLANLTDQQRQFIDRLDLTGVQGDVQRSGDRVSTIYYLVGDERRAVRRFIEENEEIVGDELGSHPPNRISTDWSDFLYELLEEEWRFWVCY